MPQGIGDVFSTERGTGARYNEGKVKLEYIPAHILATYVDGLTEYQGPADGVVYILNQLGAFEASHSPSVLAPALDACGFRDICDVFHYGAKKYAPWNWAKGMAWSVPMACAKRHLLAVARGEELDPESGLPHLGHVGCNIVMLMQFARYYPEGNDLPDRALFNIEEDF
jgi:hypothetical protein